MIVLLNQDSATPEVVLHTALEMKPTQVLVLAIDQAGNPTMMSSPLTLKELAYIKCFIDANIGQLFVQGVNHDTMGGPKK